MPPQEKEPLVKSLSVGMCSGAVALAVMLSAASAQAIVGGEPVKDGDHTYMSSLELAIGDARAQVCGATLVNEKVVMFAAHCLSQFKMDDPKTVTNLKKNLTVVVGGGSRKATSGREYKAAEFVMHPKFKNTSNRYDQAFAVLEKPVKNVSPVALTRPDAKLGVGDKITVLGWGASRKPAGQEPVDNEKLRAVGVPVTSVSPTEGTFHAGAPGKDSCENDSGGPAVVKDAQGGYRQVGIVSGGNKECSGDGVYVALNSADLWTSLGTSQDGKKIKNLLGR